MAKFHTATLSADQAKLQDDLRKYLASSRHNELQAAVEKSQQRGINPTARLSSDVEKGLAERILLVADKPTDEIVQFLNVYLPSDRFLKQSEILNWARSGAGEIHGLGVLGSGAHDK